MNAKEYLLSVGFDDSHLPKLFNNDDKSEYTIPELMEAYVDTKTSLDYKCTCKHCKEEVFEEPWDICRTCEEVEIDELL